jgi:hypothetical protein
MESSLQESDFAPSKNGKEEKLVINARTHARLVDARDRHFQWILGFPRSGGK